MVSDIFAERCRKCIREIVLHRFRGIFSRCDALVFLSDDGHHYIIVMAVFYRIAGQQLRWRRNENRELSLRIVTYKREC